MIALERVQVLFLTSKMCQLVPLANLDAAGPFSYSTSLVEVGQQMEPINRLVDGKTRFSSHESIHVFNHAQFFPKTLP